MESFDPLIMKILFGVLGFAFVSLTGIIVWLFRNMERSINKMYENQSEMRVDIAEMKKEVINMKDSLYREIDLLKNNIQHAVDQASINSKSISDINKDLGGLIEWKKLTTKT